MLRSKPTLAAAIALTALALAGAPAHAQSRTSLLGNWSGTLTIGSNDPHAMSVKNLTFYYLNFNSGDPVYGGSASCDHDACGGAFGIWEVTPLTPPSYNRVSVEFNFPDPDRGDDCTVTGRGGVARSGGSLSLIGGFTLGTGCVNPGELGVISLTNPPPAD